MPTPTFRDLITTLEKKGRLKRIGRSVDPAWEPGSLVKWMYQAQAEDRRFGFLFEQVKGSKMPLAVGVIGSCTDAYATALGVAPDEINATWVSALRNPVAPVSVSAATSQEIVHRADEARLSDLPIPVWTPGKDPGPYLSTLVITRNANTGSQNVGIYRTQVRDPHHLIVNLSPGRQGTMSAASYTDQNRPAPIAWVIGADPALALSAVANLPYGVDECNVAGALAGRPVELVKAKTIDLMVPANAEIVIEGEVLCGETGQEGPFGEFAGYMGPVGQRPLVRVTAITHRRDPIYYGLSSQMPPSESTVMQSLTNGGVILKVLRHDIGELAVRDVFVDLTFGGLLGHGIVAIKPRYPGHGKRIGRLVADMTPLKRVTVVDDDVDLRDPSHLEWALNSRFDPVHDTVIIDDVQFGNIDPSVRRINGRPGPGSKLVIDATEKTSPGTFSLPTKEHMTRAAALWAELGLPALDVPKRVRLRLDRP
jgi:UbiD family decarboxylase